MRRLAILLPILALALPAQALAAQRYASALGSGSCSQASPCSLSTAIASAADSDEVLVNPGSYTQNTSIIAGGVNLNVHGIAGQTRPVITSNVSGNSTTLFLGNNSTVRHLEFIQAGQAAAVSAFTPGPTAVNFRDLRIEIDANAANGLVTAGTSTVSNVEIWDRSINSIAIFAISRSDDSLRNVTVYSTGSGGVALLVQGGGTSSTANVLSSVLRGSAAGGLDISVADSGVHNASATVGNSNYDPARTSVQTGDTFTNAGDNQSAAPVFLSAATGNFSEQSNSPTVDAGTVDGFTPTTDLDGKVRPLGPANDIGAHEYGAATTVVTGSGAAVAPTESSVAGTVNTNDVDSTYYFDYGTTTAYGSATSAGSLGASLAGASSVTTSLSGLEPGTLYHYRIASTNVLGTSVGSDATFSTPYNPFAGVTVAVQTLKFSRAKHTAKLRVRCPDATTDTCTGSISIAASRKVKKRKLKLLRSGTSFRIAKGTVQSVTIKLSRKQYRTLRRAKRMKGTATATAHDGPGQRKTTTGKVTLKKK